MSSLEFGIAMGVRLSNSQRHSRACRKPSGLGRGVGRNRTDMRVIEHFSRGVRGPSWSRLLWRSSAGMEGLGLKEELGS